MKKDGKKEVEELKQKVQELEEKYKRALADYQNLEKRVAEERKKWIRTASKELILRLLPVLDTLELGAKHIQDEGLRLSVKQFLDVLKNEGVERIETKGRDFDPNTMECIDTVPGEENKIIQEIRAGFTLFGNVLRSVQVKVGKQNGEEKAREVAKEELQKADYM